MKTYCEVCGTSCRSKIFDKKENNLCEIYRCPKCNLFFLQNINFNNNNSTNIDWNIREKGDGSLKPLRQKNYRKILEYMNSKLESNAVGLEVGSAYGWFLELANKKYTCYGIEADDKNINIDKNFVVYKGFFPANLPKNVLNLDFIIFNDVFEHIPDCNSVLEQCNRLLKKGGYLIINLPLSTGVFYQFSSLLSRLCFKSTFNQMWQIKSNSPHLYYFNKSNLIALARKNKFKVSYFDTLDTLDRDSIYERITMMNNEKFAYLKSKILFCFFPLLSFLPKDTGYFIFKK